MRENAWFIDYKCGEWDHSYIVVHAPDKAQARKMLKHHVSMFCTPQDVANLKVNRITAWGVDSVPDDWKELPEGGECACEKSKK